ncbi:RNA polymerase sigma-70 factor [Chitinophaga arvensicola]|uniref:RNA polymerase sigma-70 factor, ECF subfamily n=1 Tax=Chitinophaga arvensicola TaxID=29529 RepID=A0A1I0RAC0_9BACT|nr:RNA polymerase sigma-70 factor [Chitinophaga arvensicola]SEW37733.1 RNA polymerase sigma-70 factor, ECF subfamily [Chitinophaga arvensicola]
MDVQKVLKEGESRNAGVVVQYFNAYFEVLHAYAYTILRDNDEAKDAVQAVFLKLWEKREELQEEQSVKSYLYTSVYHQCLNIVRHGKIKQKYIEQSDVTAHEPGNDLTSKERSLQILREIDKLPDQCKLIFSKSRFEGMKYAEIAAELGLSVKTIEAQIGKALRILRKKLFSIFIFIVW